MSWYLNRGSATEGPLTEQELVERLRSGSVREGNVCPVGGDTWTPLVSHPAFAAALAEASAPPASAGDGASPAQPTQPGAPAWPGPTSPPSPPAAPRRDKRALWVALAVAALAAVGLAAWGLFGLLAAKKPHLVRAMPKDTELYFEVPHAKRALLGLRAQRYLDLQEIDTEKLTDDAVAGFAKAFGVTDDEAEAVFAAVDAMAIGARGVARRPEASVLVQFGSAKPVETWLASKRLREDGKAGGGDKYVLTRREVEASAARTMSPAERAFSEMEVKGTRESLVWFADQRVLALGDSDFIEDAGKALRGDKPSLASTDGWRSARFDSGAHAVVWFDSAVIADASGKDARELAERFFDKTGAFTGWVRWDSAGMVMSLHGKAQGEAIRKDMDLAKPVALTLADRLPSETFLLLTAGTHLGDGRAARDNLLRALDEGKGPSRKMVEEGIEKLEEATGVKLAQAIEMFGPQGALAVLASHDLKLGEDKLSPDAWAKHFAVAYVQELRGDEGLATAEKLVRRLRTDVLDEAGRELFRVKQESGGFVGEPTKPELPHLQAVFEGTTLLVGVGAKALLDRIDEAYLQKKDTLGQDKAFRAAIGALPGKPSAIGWLDAGRVLAQATRLAPSLDSEAKKALGLGFKAIRTEGDDRLTSAVATRLTKEGSGLVYDVDFVNPLALGALGAPFAAARMGR
jgi:hypothetical protein